MGASGLPGTGAVTGGRRRPHIPIFQPQETIAGRYRIVRFLAQGGMGEVYEAVDLELRQEVALKTVSSEIGHEPATVERFKREIALARRVTHPNVCRIFDLGQHPARDELSEPITFLTMELLRGETLASALKERARILPETALPLVRQMAAALDAAHRARVVHRDFKSENVYLVPDEGADPALLGTRRVVVTDFGIARGSDGSDRFAAQVTGLGIVGTPAYMAPEQVENAPEITAAADIYALGVVIYEMVTGRLPFDGGNPLTTAVKRLQEPPPPPHVHVPDLPPWWEQTILRCLERRPEDRFGRAFEVAEALARGAALPATSEAGPSPGNFGSERSTAPPPIARPSATRAPAPRTGSGALPPQTSAGASSGPSVPGTPSATTSSAPIAPPPPASLGDTGSATAIPPAPEATRDSASRRTVALLVALLVVVAASAALMWRNRGELDPSRVRLRSTVAVLGFHNVTGREEADWISTALVEMLSTELAGGEGLRSVPGDRVAAARRQLEPGDGREPDAESLAQLRRLLGCDYVVSGSYVSLPDSENARNLRLDLRLLDAALGQAVTSLSEEGRGSELFQMVGRLGTGLREALGVDGGADDDPLAGLPENPEAARNYAEALDLLRGFRPEAARDHLEKALAVDPENPLVHSALSSAWEALGYRQKAADQARKAFELSSSLPQEDRLAIEARLRRAEGDWQAARGVYRKLWESFPDNLDYGLGLVAAETSAGAPQEALATVEQLRRLPEPLSEDPRIDLAEAEAAAVAGAIERQAQAARNAMTKAEAADARQMLARALLGLAQAERLLGRPEGTAQAAEKALALFTELDHPPGRADALTARANAHFDRGELDEAARGYRAAADVHRTLGDRGGLAASLNNLAVVRKRQGDLAGADPLYAETEAIYQEIDDARGLAVAVNNRAVILVEYDRLDEAIAMFEGSQEVWEEIGGVAGKAYALNNIAEVKRLRGELGVSLEHHLEALRIRTEANLELDRVISLTNLGSLRLARGELDEADRLLTQAAELAERVGDRASLAQARFDLGNLALARGRLEDARGHHDSALELRQELRQTLRQTASRIALARLSLLEGDAGAAEELASIARFQSQSDGRPADQARATAVLIEALYAQGRLDEARELAAAAGPLLENSSRPAVRFALERSLARVQGISSPEAALRELERASAGAAELGLALEHLELQLAAAEMASGREPPGEVARRLGQIRATAERLGAGLYVERAEEVATSP